MDEPGVQTLLDAVRRHLWRERGRIAVRRAGWLSAATTLLAGAVHLAALPISVDPVLAAVGAEWAMLLASAALRRPTDGECALWIDRHLGGASAFTTLLDSTIAAPAPAHAQARRWLERWAEARVPDVLRSLGERRSAVAISRALLAMVVCSALTLFVLSLSDTGPASRGRAPVAADVASRDPASASVEVPVAAQVASDIADALRSPESPSAAERKRADAAPTAGPTRADDEGGSPPSSSQLTPMPAQASTARDSGALAAIDPGSAAGRGQSTDAASGRDAGDAVDTRAELGVSRAPTGTIAQQRSGSPLRLPGAERQADMEQAGGFDDGVSAGGGMKSRHVIAAAAATPPAVATARMSAIEENYVQAWMKATGRSR